MFNKTVNSDKSARALQQLERQAYTQVEQILLNMYEKDQVKNLTKVAMANHGPDFNDEAFDNQYTQLATLNPTRYHKQGQGRSLPQKLPPLGQHELRGNSQLIKQLAEETSSLLSAPIYGKKEAK